MPQRDIKLRDRRNRRFRNQLEPLVAKRWWTEETTPEVNQSPKVKLLSFG